MNPREFFDKVSLMRKATKEVARRRWGRALTDSRRREQEIDAESERVNRVLTERRNEKMNCDNEMDR